MTHLSVRPFRYIVPVGCFGVVRHNPPLNTLATPSNDHSCSSLHCAMHDSSCFHRLSLRFHCLSLRFHRLSWRFHRLPLRFHCLPLRFHRLPLRFHCRLRSSQSPSAHAASLSQVALEPNTASGCLAGRLLSSIDDCRSTVTHANVPRHEC